MLPMNKHPTPGGKGKGRMRAAASLDLLARLENSLLGYRFACQEPWTKEEECEQRKKGFSGGEFRQQRQERPRGESGEEKEDTAAAASAAAAAAAAA